MHQTGQKRNTFARRASDVTHIARPESVVLLTAMVRAALEMQSGPRIEGLKERVSEGGYAVTSKDLAQGVLANKV
jgi:anti-sigma28 factor (negative regulator of flagellin synthesis)